MAPISLNRAESNNSSSTNSSITVISNLISNLLPSRFSFKRRNAVYKFNPETVLGHIFDSILLKEPTRCSQCRNTVWGLEGFKCKSCNLISHRKCFNKITGRCVKQSNQNSSTTSPDLKSHKFRPTYFMLPTFCGHCGTILVGITNRQGVQCAREGGCGIALHFECENLTCHPCVKLDKHVIETHTDKGHVSDRIKSTSKENQISIKDFELIRLLGTGTFSKVYLAKYKTTQQEFAIKVLKKTNLVVISDPNSVITEKYVLELGRNYTFLAVAHCCFQSEDRLYFVMEHVVGRDLVYHIVKARKFTEDRSRFYAAEIFLALRFLHSRRIIYRDLKLDNVLLDEQGHCKLIDFGMSKELSSEYMKTNTFCGTPNYISPETIKDEAYGFSVDWWAFGVLIYEMLIGESPFNAEDEEQLYKRIVSDPVVIPKFISNDARNLVEGLLQKDPKNRLGCQLLEGCEQAIKDHPFFIRTSDGEVPDYWDKVEAKQIPPPYRPSKDELDSICQDCSDCSLTPIDHEQLTMMTANDFYGFSFCSDSFRSTMNVEKSDSNISIF